MRFGGIVLAAVLALAACSSEPEPKEPTTTASSASPSVAVPTMPAQAKEDSPEGAAAFVHHYIDVFNYAASTGDVAELTRLSAPECEGCQSYIKLYKDTYAAGGYFKGGEWKLGEMQFRQSGNTAYLTAVASTEPGPYRESAEGPELTSSGQDNEVSFAIEPRGSSWLVVQFGLGDIQ